MSGIYLAIATRLLLPGELEGLSCHSPSDTLNPLVHGVLGIRGCSFGRELDAALLTGREIRTRFWGRESVLELAGSLALTW